MRAMHVSLDVTRTEFGAQLQNIWLYVMTRDCESGTIVLGCDANLYVEQIASQSVLLLALPRSFGLCIRAFM